ncbi:MAG: hypothetical protein ACOYL5_10915 [Phototrophicaceae bacterium]
MQADVQTAVYKQLVALVKGNLPDDFEVIEASGRIDINTRKPAEVNGKRYPNLNLVSVVVQKGHVGFYYFPIYIEPSMADGLSAPLAKMLKGKTCFHCKKPLTPELEQEIIGLLASGVSMYRGNGWL